MAHVEYSTFWTSLLTLCETHCTNQYPTKVTNILLQSSHIPLSSTCGSHEFLTHIDIYTINID